MSSTMQEKKIFIRVLTAEEKENGYSQISQDNPYRNYNTLFNEVLHHYCGKDASSEGYVKRFLSGCTSIEGFQNLFKSWKLGETESLIGINFFDPIYLDKITSVDEGSSDLTIRNILDYRRDCNLNADIKISDVKEALLTCQPFLVDWKKLRGTESLNIDLKGSSKVEECIYYFTGNDGIFYYDMLIDIPNFIKLTDLLYKNKYNGRSCLVHTLRSEFDVMVVSEEMLDQALRDLDIYDAVLDDFLKIHIKVNNPEYQVDPLILLAYFITNELRYRIYREGINDAVNERLVNGRKLAINPITGEEEVVDGESIAPFEGTDSNYEVYVDWLSGIAHTGKGEKGRYKRYIPNQNDEEIKSFN